ncbi:MAG: protein adenylyltransferase SelO family protein, partial [Proteobacteria bacterium]|nr:protein adenylyltransferase SelO family protein [Pseudomonadota bacterium]
MEHLLKFDNASTRGLPADPVEGPGRRQISRACYSRVRPTPVSAPELVAYAKEVAEAVGLDEQACRSADFVNTFTGNQLLAGMDPHATCYGGHQFGNWAGQLGDGRAINLGEVASVGGTQMLQLKGAGETPYSRTADGRAVLRSSVREFLCS